MKHFNVIYVNQNTGKKFQLFYTILSIFLSPNNIIPLEDILFKTSYTYYN